jgi:hypothetical protein
VLALDACVGRNVPQQVLTKPVPATASMPAPSGGPSWLYRPTSQRVSYAVDQRAQLTIREDAVVSLDSVSSHAEVSFSVAAQASRVAGAVTAFSVQHSGRVATVPQGLSLPFPFVATYAQDARQLVFIAPSASPCLTPTVTVLNSLRDLWFQMPDSVRVGTTWDDSASYASCRDGVPLRSDVRRTFRVSSVSEPGGHVLLLLRRGSRTTISGHGTLTGEPVNVEGLGTGEIEYTIDPLLGELLSAHGSFSLELTLHGKARAQTVRQAGDIRIDRSS